ncbi:MAG TPA: D-inositol-3-phosphate glycosyltransferase [Marmoricola sp.]|nr:D-inositol-3-phosphate glycosyltransferase [Marmoricola sp.]
MISLHTSPLDQPGTGDAGGLNVYVTEVARELAARGVEVDIFTRATRSDQPARIEATPGVNVRHVLAGPFEGLSKDALPAQLCTFAREVLRAEAEQPPTHYDIVHSHYWLSGQVGALARDRWGVPLVHTMHTMAKVKNALLAEGDCPEPAARIIGEEQVVAAADMLIANTDEEAKDLINSYSADPGCVEVVQPGVDLTMFNPRSMADARGRLGLSADGDVLLFVGRIQPLKAPDVLLRAAAVLLEREPARRGQMTVAIVGGPSGSGLEHPESLENLAQQLGISDLIRFVPPVDRATLADWYSAASVVCVPSYSESFGLVALEAEAAGTPVVAAAVGGLPTAVRHGVSGLLVDGHDPHHYAAAIGSILDDPGLHESLSKGAVKQAAQFTWSRAADRILEIYGEAQKMREVRG